MRTSGCHRLWRVRGLVLSFSQPRRCLSQQQQHQQEARGQILEHALKHVGTLGWTQHALAQAAVDSGMTSLSSSLIHRGPVEMVEHFLQQKRAHVLAASAASATPDSSSGSSGSSTTEPARLEQELYKIIEAHMEYLGPHRETWPSALALLAEPHNAASTMALLHELADDLCAQAGIKSSRMDWYTERGLLLSLYGATEMYFLTDTSPDLGETKRFLKRALEAYSAARSVVVLK